MKVKLEKLSSVKKRIFVEIEEEELNKEWEEIYKQLGKEVKVPGFRPGSVPPEVVKMRFKDLAARRLLEKVIPQSFSKIIQDHNFKPVNEPSVSDIKLKDNSLEFTFTVDIIPEFDPPSYRGIPLRVEEIKIDDEEVEKLLSNIKEEFKKNQNISLPADLEDKKFCQSLGCKDKEELKTFLKAQLYLAKFNNRLQNLRNQLIEHLVKEKKNLEIPPALLDRYHKEIVNQEIELLKQRGIKEEDIVRIKKHVEEKSKPVVEKQLRFYLILEKIAQKEGIEIKEDEQFEDRIISFLLSEADFK